MKKWFASLLCLVALWGSSIGAYEQDMLKATDVHKIMKQILEHHVSQKSLSTKILQSALVIYIDQFDPHRLYLLASEVDSYSHLPEDKLKQYIVAYNQDNFSVFKELNQVIQAAIERSRKIRQQIEFSSTEIFNKKLPTVLPDETERDFAATVDELKARLQQNFLVFVESQKRRYGEAAVEQKKDEIITSYENRLREFENQYLYQNEKGEPLPPAEQVNLATIHILKALASSLDAHTSFYQANEAYDLRVRLQKEFQGVGLILKDSPGGAVVSNLLESGPAAKSGLIKVGDILLEVDGDSVADHPFEKVMEMLHDSRDDTVTLVFKRPGSNGTKDQIYTVKLKREMIVLNNDRVDVSSEPFANGIIGKITLHAFYQGEDVTSEQDVKNAILKLEKEGNLKGLILDLRDNSGGFLSQAVKVAGLFISNGVIVISKYSNGEERFYRDVNSQVVFDGPLVVLTSKATASAAEIVAQALQDYGVAVIVGDEHTYGKGTIQTQTVTDNQSTSYFKVTVGKYYTVSGKTPQKQGVKADILVPGHWNNQAIGEEYLDSVGADTIPPAYNDTLKDVPESAKAWYLKYYVPNIQHKKTTWRNLLPTLKKNSEYRIAHNKNYQYYLKGGKDTPDTTDDEDSEWNELGGKKSKTFGEDDLQMQEAVNIVKDMIIMHSLGNTK